ncbi:MAG: hypothetical protein K0R81_892 [Microbacterium sp.]|jgi:hypothetical protein|nr:hypothetical protein [Microbacterium sp.]
MSHGLIDPSKLPGHDLDLAGVSQAAADISSRGGSIQQAGTDVASSWSTLPASYESTGAESVYVAMNPVRDASDRVGGDLTAVASALTDWVTTVQPILTRLADLRTDAEAFVVEANNFASRVTWTNNLAVSFMAVPVDNWWEDPDMVQRNADLVDQGYLLGEQLRVANEDLANAIRRSAGLSTNAVAPAATTAPDNLQTDWGSASPREESCAEKTIGFPMHFTGGVLNGAWDMVGGLGMLVGGYDFKSWPPPAWGMVGDMLSGDFQGAADRGGDWLSGWGQSWMGLGHLVTGVSMGFMAPVMTEVVAPGQIADLKAKGADTGFLEWQQQWMRDSYRSYIDLFGSFVGYHAPEEWWNASPDQWGEGWSDWGKDPGATAGTSLFNIATLVLPTKGGGALLDGLKGGRGAEGLGDDVGRVGTGDRGLDLGSSPLRPGGLADDLAKFGGAQDDLASTLGRSPLDDGGTLLDDIRGGDHLVRPDADVPRVHAGDPDVQHLHLGDGDGGLPHERPGVRDTDGTPGSHSDGPPGADPGLEGSGTGRGPRGREYSLMDGSDHVSKYAPEDLGTSRIDSTLLQRHGVTHDQFVDLINRPIDTLTPAEKNIVNDLRDDLTQKLTPDTVYQKVLDQPHFATQPDGSVELVLGQGENMVLNNTDRVTGSVSVVEDTSHLTNPTDFYRSLRLDYPGTNFLPDDRSSFVLRFQQDIDTSGSINPQLHSSMGGDGSVDHYSPPFTGNGFLKSGDDIIPEYRARDVEMREGAEVWEVLDDGTQRLFAVLRGGEWIPVG